MKLLKLLILSLCCISLSLPAQGLQRSPSSFDYSTIYYAYFKAIGSKVKLFTKLNAQVIKFRQGCLQGSIPEYVCREEMDTFWQNLRTEMPSARQHIFNYYLTSQAGMFFAMYLDIATISEHLTNPISQDAGLRRATDTLFSRAKHPLASFEIVYELGRPQFSAEQIRTLVNEKNLYITETIGEESTKPLPYLYNINGYLEYLCDQLHTERRSQYGYDLPNAEKRPLCSRIKFDYDIENKAFYPTEIKLAPGDKDFLAELTLYGYGAQAQKASEEIRNRYLSITRRHPHIIFLASFEEALQKMDGIFTHMLDETNKQFSIVEDMLTKLDNDKNDLMKVGLPFMAYGDIADLVLEEPTSDMETLINLGVDFEEVHQQLIQMHANAELWTVGKQIIGAIALTAACYIPVGRAVKATRWVTASIWMGKAQRFKFLCLPGVTLATNTYFFVDSYLKFKDTYSKIYASPEGKVLLAELGSLESYELELVLNAVFLPMGVVPAGVLSAKTLSGLSSSALKLIQKRGTYAH